MYKEYLSKQLEEKFGISTLNDIQNSTIKKWETCNTNIVLYSPTGSGKSLAFALPILQNIEDSVISTQVLIIVPTRELAIQTTTFLKKLAPTVKITCCYGGHNSQDEQLSLSSNPTIVVSTPGRLHDHIRRNHLILKRVTTLVLDEFDKSLELGFTDEMRGIVKSLPSAIRIIMTSATVIKNEPEFIDIKSFETLNFLHQEHTSPNSRITTWLIDCKNTSPIDCMIRLIKSLPDEKTIIFSNHRETAQQVNHELNKAGIMSGLYIGSLEQIEREKAYAMFNNGSTFVLSATDLAARGLDISDVKHIIHYEMPISEETFIHRNGRTARVDATGNVYVLKRDSENLAPFIKIDTRYDLNKEGKKNAKQPSIATLHISAGKKEKISRGDIVGYLLSNSNLLSQDEIGRIDIFDHYALVAVPRTIIKDIIKVISPFKLKKQKVKLSIAKLSMKFAR